MSRRAFTHTHTHTRTQTHTHTHTHTRTHACTLTQIHRHRQTETRIETPKQGRRLLLCVKCFVSVFYVLGTAIFSDHLMTSQSVGAKYEGLSAPQRACRSAYIDRQSGSNECFLCQCKLWSRALTKLTSTCLSPG